MRLTAIQGLQLGGQNLNYWKFHPWLFIRIAAFDESRSRVYSEKISVYDFDKIERVQYSTGAISVRNSETISPD